MFHWNIRSLFSNDKNEISLRVHLTIVSFYLPDLFFRNHNDLFTIIRLRNVDSSFLSSEKGKKQFNYSEE